MAMPELVLRMFCATVVSPCAFLGLVELARKLMKKA